MLFSRITAVLLAMGACIVGSAACGNSKADNRNYGAPPNPSDFNPGDNTGGSGYYGNASGSTAPTCPAALQACPHTFTLQDDNYVTVELRGDWDGQSSWDSGVPMTKSGTTWSASVPLPVSTAVQYRFFLNGTTWFTDPTQPTEADSSGDSNNLYTGGTCATPTCSEQGQLPPGVFDWRDSTIYFVFVDRFNDGVPTNNCHATVDPTNNQPVSGNTADYQGGDWAGVTAKITSGYFSDLGINTLWVTVPIENPLDSWEGTSGDTHEYSGYHGYWPSPSNVADPTQISPESCFGTIDDLKTLVSTAHASGLKVLFDYAMVHVHTESALYKAHTPAQNQMDGWFWPFNYNGEDCICNNGNDQCSWNNGYKHCWFADYLAHWNYTNADARAWSVANAAAWVTATQDSSGNGADGFRCDAIKHVETSWLNDLRTKLNTDVIANQNPKQRFYMVGETYDFDDSTSDGNGRDFIKSFVNPTTLLDGQFDFPLRLHAVNALLMRKEGMDSLASFMDSNDYFYGADAIMSPFLGNHDLPRIIHLAQNTPLWGDQGTDGKHYDDGTEANFSNQPQLVTETEAYERVANGFALLYTNRGAPLLYYGDEYGMFGAGDPDNRHFMQWSGYTPNQQYLHDRIKTLLGIRAKHPALRRGVRATIGSTADTWVYSRTTTGDTVYVAINRSDNDQTIGGLPSGTLNEEVTGTTITGPGATIPKRQTRIFTAPSH